jgi:hypothetical protein
VIAKVIEAELLTVLPPASWIVTVGCVPNALPAVAVLLGSVVKANFAAAPSVMLNVLLVAEVSPLLVAVSW